MRTVLILVALMVLGCDTYTPVKRANTDPYIGRTIESFRKSYNKLSIMFTDGDSLVIVGGGYDAACYFGIQD